MSLLSGVGFKSKTASWQQTRVTFGDELRESSEKDPNIEAVGIGGQIYGKRADMILIDDAVTLSNANDFELNTVGSLKCGKRVRGINLLFTDVDVHTATYVGLPYVYSFERVGSGCGVISSQSVAAIDSAAIWMSRSGFWIFDGYVKPLPCDVSDYVFTSMNYNQASKVYAVHNSKYGEVWWFYPSSASNEVDSYVTYNYREGHWNIGTLGRTAGVDRGIFLYPIMVDASGYIYEHEVGYDYDSGSVYAESGPYEIGVGENITRVKTNGTRTSELHP